MLSTPPFHHSDIDLPQLRRVRHERVRAALAERDYAAIVEGVLSRYLKGVMGGEADTDLFRVQVEALAEEALELASTQ